MKEVTVNINIINPLEVLGINNSNLSAIRSYYPHLKIAGRGNQIKVIGETQEIQEFKLFWDKIMNHFSKFKTIDQNVIQNIFMNSEEKNSFKDEVILYGINGLVVKAKTNNQRKLLDSAQKNDLIFVLGPAGTGKTYTAIALAVKALKEKQVKKIILTRPAVEAGEHLGFLPGDVKEKLDPYLQPLYDALKDMISLSNLKKHIDKGVIEIAPIGFMRGRTLDKAFVILDEAQNTTDLQMKMFLTRMGPLARFIVTGDLTQIDLPNNQKSGLLPALKKLKNIKDVDIIYLDEKDILRHRLVKDIIKAYNKK